MVHAQPRIRHGKWDAQTSMGFWNTNGSPNLGQTTRPCNNKKTKKKRERTCQIVDFAILADHRAKLKERKKKDKFLDLVRKLKKKVWNMKVTVISVVIGALGGHQRTGAGTGGLGNKSTNGDHPNHNIVELSVNSEKCPGHLRRFTVTQSPVKNRRCKNNPHSRKIMAADLIKRKRNIEI